MPSSQSFSRIHCRIRDSPDSAAPVKSGEPLKTIATRLPPLPSAVTGFIFESMCWRKSSEPSLIRGRPAPKRPLSPSVSYSFSTSSLTFFHSTPNGGLASR